MGNGIPKVTLNLVYWHPVEEGLPDDHCTDELIITVRDNETNSYDVWDGVCCEEIGWYGCDPFMTKLTDDNYNHEKAWFLVDYYEGNSIIEDCYTVVAWAVKPFVMPYIPEEVTE